jgi:hypothetical protein
MSFIRPELRTHLRRWREALAGGAVAILGLWWLLGSGGVVALVGAVLLLAGGTLVAAGVQRGRFRRGGDGPGVVQLDEGQLSYFGPLSGGIVAVAQLTEVALDPRAHPSPVWVLHGAAEGPIHVPVDAAGAEALFDVFASLPGIRTERIVAALARPPTAPVTLWRRAGATSPRRAGDVGRPPTLH